jgi:hypothetical protein
MLAGAGGSDMATVSELKEELGARPLAKPMHWLCFRCNGELVRRIPLAPEEKYCFVARVDALGCVKIDDIQEIVNSNCS